MGAYVYKEYPMHIIDSINGAPINMYRIDKHAPITKQCHACTTTFRRTVFLYYHADDEYSPSAHILHS